MFEDRTYEKIMEETLAEAPPGVDIRQGSIFYDAVAGVCFKIASYYADLSSAIDLVFLTTAVDEYLDDKGAEYGIYRNPATSAVYEFVCGGTEPRTGERFFTEGEYFLLRRINGVLCLEAESTGSGTNYVAEGTPAVPVNNIVGLSAASFGPLVEPGVDVEGDEDYRQRIREKIAGPAENGNRQHYKTWCEEVPGVGRARIIPLFAGENSVMGVITGADGAPAVQAVVERVQEYIDPITLGGTVEYGGRTLPIGDGLGNGTANIGAHFAAVAAEKLSVAVSFSALVASGYTAEQAREAATAAITDHLKDLALNTPDSEHVVVRISTIGALLTALPEFLDYSALTFNGAATNIEVSDTQVAVLEEVTLHEIVR